MQLIAVVFTDWLGTLGQWTRFMSVFCCLKGGGVDGCHIVPSLPPPPPPLMTRNSDIFFFLITCYPILFFHDRVAMWYIRQESPLR